LKLAWYFKPVKVGRLLENVLLENVLLENVLLENVLLELLSWQASRSLQSELSILVEPTQNFSVGPILCLSVYMYDTLM